MLCRHGKKIWLTEFAKSGTSNEDKVTLWTFLVLSSDYGKRIMYFSMLQALEFMQEILPLLEEHEGIHKYSWFENR